MATKALKASLTRGKYMLGWHHFFPLATHLAATNTITKRITFAVST
jgi:hypothetical protein